MRNVWIAIDGTQFDGKDDCEKYEIKLASHLMTDAPIICLDDEDRNITEQVLILGDTSAIRKVAKIYIDSKAKYWAQQLLILFNHEPWVSIFEYLPDDELLETVSGDEALFYYDSDKDIWVELFSAQEKIEKSIKEVAQVIADYNLLEDR